MPTSSPLHEAARAWAQAGFYVFPCRVNGKEPAISRADGGHGLDDATTDLDQIDRWWTENPQYNIGVAPERSGMFVLDVDPPLGADTLAALEAENGALPTTLAIRTPRGGLHYWFTGECQSTVQKLGPKLDTRGAGGYVLVPPSATTDGSYDYTGESDDISIAPSWIKDTIRDRHAAVAAAGNSVGLDTPSAIGRAENLLHDYVGSGHVAVEGSGGDALTYATAAEVLNLGLSPDKAFEVMQDWNAACVPPWSDDELRTKIANAAAYAQNDQGAWAVPPAQELFGAFIAATTGDNHRSKFYPRDENEQEQRPDPTWLLEGMLPADATIMMFGPSGSYKTFLALDMALTLASGRPAYGLPERPPSPVVYIAAEGSRGIEKFRRPAWREARGIDRPLPFYTIDAMPLIARPNEVIEMIEAVKARGIQPALVVLDTLARAMAGKNENDAKDTGELIEGIEAIKRALGCSVLVLHHTGKDDGRGARGSSSLGAGFDSVLEVKAQDTVKAVSLSVAKHKDADRPETPWTFEGHKVASSLVFFETDTVTHNRLTKGDDAFSPIKIGEALRVLRAIGQAAGITTHVLAAHIVPQVQSETAEDRQRVIGRAERQLKALANGRLEAYTDRNGKALRWYLPETDIDT